MPDDALLALDDAVLLARTLGGLADIAAEPEDRQRERGVRSRQLIRVLEKNTERLQQHWSPGEFGGRLWDSAKRLWCLAAGPWAWWPLIRDLIGLYGKLDEREMQLLAQPLQ